MKIFSYFGFRFTWKGVNVDTNEVPILLFTISMKLSSPSD